MGYYTEYVLSVENPSPTIDTANMSDDISHMLYGMQPDVFINQWYCNAKWYDYREDMIALSEKYPDVLFKLSGSGEDSEDVWIDYFFGGKYQHCHATITFDEYDPAKLTHLEKRRAYDGV